jgi:hypothetical protein
VVGCELAEIAHAEGGWADDLMRWTICTSEYAVAYPRSQAVREQGLVDRVVVRAMGLALVRAVRVEAAVQRQGLDLKETPERDKVLDLVCCRIQLLHLRVQKHKTCHRSGAPLLMATNVLVSVELG